MTYDESQRLNDPVDLLERLTNGYIQAGIPAHGPLANYLIVIKLNAPECFLDAVLDANGGVAPKTVTGFVEMLNGFRRIRRPGAGFLDAVADVAVSLELHRATGRKLTLKRSSELHLRVCGLCWRTVPMKVTSKDLFARCHEHYSLGRLTAPSLEDDDIAARSNKYAEASEEINRIRRNTEFVERLLDAAPDEAVYNLRVGEKRRIRTPKKMHQKIFPPLGPVERWLPSITFNFPRTVEYFLEKGLSLDDPGSTLQALEGRRLTDDEILEMDDPWLVLAVIKRCEEWLILIELVDKKKELKRNTILPKS